MELRELIGEFEGEPTFSGGNGEDIFEGGRGGDIIIGDSGTSDGEAGGGETDDNTITITVENLSDTGGTFKTPLFFGFHDGSFDIFDIGSEASLGLERLAEDGATDDIENEFDVATGGNGISGVISNGGPLAPGEEASTTITLTDAQTQAIFSWATMVIPSNDAFIASPDDPLAARIFDDNGDFLGPVEINVTGADVLDAGTEANLELEAAFLNQTGPDTGIDGNGTVTPHLGFNGSAGNPTTENVNILADGAVTATGIPISAEAADFTLDPSTPILRISIEQADAGDGSGEEGGNDQLSGGLGDDFIDGRGGDDELNGDRGDDLILGGAGDDIVNGGRGDDEIEGGSGDDQLFGNRGDDFIDGGEGDDDVIGGRGDDQLLGGLDNDNLSGDRGDDLLNGGAGDDLLEGGIGSDIFVFSAGSGFDEIVDFGFGGLDQIDVRSFGFASADDLINTNALQQGDNTLIDLSGDGNDQLLLVGVATSELDQGNFII